MQVLASQYRAGKGMEKTTENVKRYGVIVSGIAPTMQTVFMSFREQMTKTCK